MPITAISSISLTNVVLLSYVLDDQGTVVHFPLRARAIVFSKNVETGSGAQVAFYSVDTSGFFPLG